MKRPVPPSNFRSTGDFAEDLRRIRQHQQEVLEWIDDQIAGIDIPVGGVTSFNARTGAVVPVAGDYTKSDVGLGNVTNDAQLKRADNDWGGYTTQTGAPAAGDKFIIERASDNAKRIMLASSLGSVYSRRDPIWDPPTTASADDDEFTSDTILSGAWNIGLAATPGTPLTRDGAVDLTQAITSGHYRSTCIDSTLYVQIRQNEQVYVWKTLAGALTSHQLWFAAVGMPTEVSVATASDPAWALQMWKNTGGVPDAANRAISTTRSSADRHEIVGIIAGATTTIATNAFALVPLDGLALRINHGSNAANNAGGFGWTRNGNTQTINNVQTPQFNASTDKVGISLLSNITNGPVAGVNNTLFALHFIRRANLGTGGWLAQA